MTDELSSLLKQGADHLLDARRLNALLPLIPSLLALALMLTGCGQQPAEAPAPPRSVKYVTVRPAVPAPDQALTGEVRAYDETALSFRLEGHLLTRIADIGMHVRSGDVLATIDSRTMVNQVSSARSDLTSTRAAEQVALLNLKRMQALMPSGAIARAQLDSASADWQAARSRRESSEAALKTAQENLRWTSLTATSDGVVTSVSASAGQVVSAGQTVLTIASGNSRDAIVDVSDPSSIPRLSGDVFRVALLSDAAVSAVGHLRDISPQADPQTRTWRVRITLTDPPPEMVLGASVTVMLPARGVPSAELPASALTRLAGRPAVFILDPVQQSVKRRIVVIDRYSATSVFISGGVMPGDRVIIAGVNSLRDGERVATGEGDA